MHSETTLVRRAIAHVRAQPVRCTYAARQRHMYALVWTHVLTKLSCDGDAVRSRCFALRDASRGRLLPLRDSVTPLPPVTLFVDHPRVLGRVIPERLLSSPCREKKRQL